jgi:cytochrome P450
VSTRRKVLKPFTLSNGVHVDRGDWLATPLTPMLRDPKNWVDPLEFQGFRHLSTKILMTLDSPPLDFRSLEPGKAAPLTDTRGWQTWGTGRMAW